MLSFAVHMMTPPGQGMPKRWMKEPPSFCPQTSLHPFESLHEFFGPGPLPMAEPRVLGPSFVLQMTPAVPAEARVGAFMRGVRFQCLSQSG